MKKKKTRKTRKKCENCGEKKHARRIKRFRGEVWLCPTCMEACEPEINPEI